MIKLKTFHQTGDTIVEVLIAVAVVSLVLSSTFAITSRITASIHQSQEHAVALKYAETQLEILRVNNAASLATKIFCSSSITTGAIKTANTGVGLAFGSYPTLAADTLTTYTPDCQFNAGVGTTTYYIGIDRSAGVSSPHIFTVHVRWLNIHGSGNDEVTLEYKI